MLDDVQERIGRIGPAVAGIQRRGEVVARLMVSRVGGEPALELAKLAAGPATLLSQQQRP